MVLFVPDSGKCSLIVDSRYTEEAKREATGVRIIEAPGAKLFEGARSCLSERGPSNPKAKIGFEGRILTYYQVQKAIRAFRGHQLTDQSGMVETLRAIKQDHEISSIKRSQDKADKTFKHLLQILRPGMTEKEVSFAAESYIKTELGAEFSFPMIAASGPNSSMPHARPTNRKIKRNDILKLDFGVLFDGYACDMTRTVFFGKVAERWREIYSVVLEAQLLALSGIKAGMKCAKIDKIARDYVDNSGFKGLFQHGLGHGIGIEVHEAPVLGGASQETLREGMVVSVEPGIYIAGTGGVRIEDLVVVTKSGHVNLTHSTKELISINL